MNCSTCRYELSQCLDGRLPSGRRTIVLQHASQCEACGTFWNELQAAQRLTLRLQRPRVSENFRESLWERVQAGEGTPDAVFREPVPLLAKLRYALTGAAAAAAALLCVTWFGPRNDGAATHTVAKIEPRGIGANTPPIVDDNRGANAQLAFGHSAASVGSWFGSPSRLGLNEVAREAAKQFDNRLAEATAALHRVENGNSDAIEQVFVNTHEFVAFGDLLLDLSRNGSLVFTDPGAEPNLRDAVTLLTQGQARPSMQTIRDVVKPALQRNQLQGMSGKITMRLLDPPVEQEAMVRIKMYRPEILPKLFFIVSSGERAELSLLPDAAFQMDECGLSYGVPLSEVRAFELRGRALLAPR